MLNSGQSVKKKVILHCGAPKTATSSLQSILLKMKQDLMDQGVFYMERRPFKGEKYKIHQAFILAKTGREDVAPARAADCLENVFEASGAHTLLLSNESVLHDPLLEDHRNFYPRMEEIAERLKDMFKDYDLHIRFMIRNQADHLPSYYTQRVRQGLTCNLNDYAHCFDLENLRWSGFIDRLKNQFGADKVHYNCFENYRQDTPATIKALFPEITHISLADADTHKNASPSAFALDYMRHYNNLLDKLFGSNKTLRHKMQRNLREKQFPILERLFWGKKLKLDPDLYDKLSSLYQKDRHDLNI